MPTSKNRTKWPISGGAVSLQPGWFPGHSSAHFYINMGYDNEPLNYSHVAVPLFSITGPSNSEYNGTFCLPQVPLPANYTPKVGDNATIQVIEVAQHGASLYNVSLHPFLVLSLCFAGSVLIGDMQCADITFAEDGDPEIPNVNQTNCFNSTQPDQRIGFQAVYTTTPGAAPLNIQFNPYVSLLAPLMLVVASWVTWL